MEALKPCPFCGSENISIRRSEARVVGDGPFEETYSVRCLNCGASPGGPYLGSFDRKKGEFVFGTDGYAQAVSAWNRRASTEPET